MNKIEKKDSKKVVKKDNLCCSNLDKDANPNIGIANIDNKDAKSACCCNTQEEKSCECGKLEETCGCESTTDAKSCECGKLEETCGCESTTDAKSCECGKLEETCGCESTTDAKSCECNNNEEACECKDNKEIKETCGCTDNKQSKEKEKSCCEHKKEEQPLHSCCGKKEKNSIVEDKSGLPLHTCCSSKKKEETVASCCSTDKEHTHEDGAPCGCGIIHKEQSKFKVWAGIGISLLALIVSFINPFHMAPVAVRFFDFAWIAIVICGLPIFRGAIVGLKNKKITSSLLISIAMIASIVMFLLTLFGVMQGGHGHGDNYLFVAGEVAFLMAIGSKIEDLTSNRARSLITNLIKTSPNVAMVMLENGEIIEVDTSKIKIDDRIVVRPHDIIAVDGEVIDGTSSIDQALITGESVAVDVKIGSKVYAGTRNTHGALVIKAKTLSQDSTLSKLINYVKEAEKKKAPIARLADKWAGYIVPTAVSVSILVFFFVWLVLSKAPLDALQRAITILVVFCPCALALATPTAIAASIGNASKNGILIKGGNALEALAKIDTIALDKTGTLTEGKLRVDKVTTKELSEEVLLQFAASAEAMSEHPIAQAILASNKLPLLASEETTSIQGVGVRCILKDKTVIEVSKLSTLEDESAQYDDLLSKLNQAKTVIVVKINGVLAGGIALSDTIREGAKEAIAELNKKGYKTIMLTGDNKYSAKTVSKQLEIQEHFAELMPADKVATIESYRQKGAKILMVGDGVNDAPALATADVSLAMGAMTNTVAMETADISLMQSDITKLPNLLSRSKRTIKIIKLNIAISMTINVIAIILSTMGILNAVSGAFVHNASSILVCLNSARLLR